MAVDSTMAAAPMCSHLADLQPVAPRADGCEECLASGDSWVHLRLCLTCGHVGCCNDSKNRHATQHFHETEHPVIQSFEPGEDWRWCYVDEVSPAVTEEGYEKDLLRGLPLFAGLSEEDLDRLYQMARTMVVPAGYLLMEEGHLGDSAYVVVEGELEVTRRQGGEDVMLAVRRHGEVVGEMAVLGKAPRTATVRAARDSRLLEISREAFQTLLTCSPTAPESILHEVISRLHSTESLLMQQEKMAGLGTMAAGLAHELNNPAGALRRIVPHLSEALASLERSAAELSRVGLSPEQQQAVESLRAAAATRAATPVRLDPLARTDLEDALQEWLEDHGVEKAWEVAPSLVSRGWDVASLQQHTQPFHEEQLGAVARWLGAASESAGLLDEMQRGTEQISAIVTSVKSYAYLDQAAVQEVDVHDSLENTLVMLRHKLQESGATLVREYAPDLPRIEAYGSALNQVWTNLIDNALGALYGQEGGRLVLRTGQTPQGVLVEVQDNGSGIPPEQQSRIFEPFFTTKPPGQGTGLGLHIVYSIVVDRHRGEIAVTSRPGETTFHVRLPLHLGENG